MWCSLGVSQKTIHYVVIYRPPSGSHTQFRRKFATLLEDMEAYKSDIIIAGDFNVNMDNPHSLDTQNFTQLLADFGLESHVNGPTHIGGHTLDLVITRQDSVLVWKIYTDDIISDYLMLCFTLSLRQKSTDKKRISRRSFKHFDCDKFESDLRESGLYISPSHDIDELVTQYNDTLSQLLDKHAPVIKATQNQKTSWYTQDIHNERQKRRQLTRKWRKSRAQKDKENMITQRNKVSDMIHSAKSDYCHTEITKAGKDSKSLFQIFRRLLNDNKMNPMPPGRSSMQNANEFNHFFIEKIERLKACFEENSEYSYLDGRKKSIN